MNMGVENGGFNGSHCYINSPTGSESKNHNSIYSTNKIDEIYPNIYGMETNVLQDVVDIDYMLPVSTLNKYANMEYNN